MKSSVNILGWMKTMRSALINIPWMYLVDCTGDLIVIFHLGPNNFNVCFGRKVQRYLLFGRKFCLWNFVGSCYFCSFSPSDSILCVRGKVNSTRVWQIFGLTSTNIHSTKCLRPIFPLSNHNSSCPPLKKLNLNFLILV